MPLLANWLEIFQIVIFVVSNLVFEFNWQLLKFFLVIHFPQTFVANFEIFAELCLFCNLALDFLCQHRDLALESARKLRIFSG